MQIRHSLREGVKDRTVMKAFVGPLECFVSSLLPSSRDTRQDKVGVTTSSALRGAGRDGGVWGGSVDDSWV